MPPLTKKKKAIRGKENRRSQQAGSCLIALKSIAGGLKNRCLEL